MDERTINAFARLSDILDTLREKCPWDRVQTLESLRYLTIEEVYELSDALLQVQHAKESSSSDEERMYADGELKKELGDLLMHLMFYAKIAEDEKRFNLHDALEAISNKLVARHPFIYGESSSGESWEQIKMHEGRKSVMEGVPTALPSLVKSIRIQEKAAGIGFPSQRGEQLKKELLPEGEDDEAWGELLFDLVAVANKRGINVDNALEKANMRFIKKVESWENNKQ